MTRRGQRIKKQTKKVGGKAVRKDGRGDGKRGWKEVKKRARTKAKQPDATGRMEEEEK